MTDRIWQKTNNYGLNDVYISYKIYSSPACNLVIKNL